ncbi:MAG TPA: cyclic nucleotide-binding domain-containing protein [Thermoanaerobaculia bacterium]|nr:cyclic nucleotide-binding domain-containing protein [Thermoanaerobaculia bacterium]
MAKTVFKTTGKRSDYTIEVAPEEYVFREGDLGTEMYIIHEGQVEILNRVGEEEKLLAVLEKGDFFGEMALLEDRPRLASARALTPARLLQINGATFDQMLRDNPEIAVRMMRKLSRRLRETDDLLKAALGTSGTAGSSTPEMPTPDLTEMHMAGPERLIHAPSGMEFSLSRGSETTIGRKDPVTGIYPDVDLTPIDSQRSVSRRHAKIYRRGSKFFLSEEIGTMNATFQNGARLETGVPAELKPGDEVRCGVVVLKFEVP